MSITLTAAAGDGSSPASMKLTHPSSCLILYQVTQLVL